MASFASRLGLSRRVVDFRGCASVSVADCRDDIALGVEMGHGVLRGSGARRLATRRGCPPTRRRLVGWRRFRRGKMPATRLRRLISLLMHSRGVGGPDLLPVPDGEGRYGEHLGLGAVHLADPTNHAKTTSRRARLTERDTQSWVSGDSSSAAVSSVEIVHSSVVRSPPVLRMSGEPARNHRRRSSRTDLSLDRRYRASNRNDVRLLDLRRL